MHNNSGWAKGWNGDGRYVAERAKVPGCGGIMVAECADRRVGCDGAIVCIGINSFASDGGNPVVGTDPGIVGDTAMKERKKQID